MTYTEQEIENLAKLGISADIKNQELFRCYPVEMQIIAFDIIWECFVNGELNFENHVKNSSEIAFLDENQMHGTIVYCGTDSIESIYNVLGFKIKLCISVNNGFEDYATFIFFVTYENILKFNLKNSDEINYNKILNSLKIDLKSCIFQ